MNGGIIQQIDTPARVYQRPANQFVANFIGLSNFLPASVSRKGEELSILFPEGGYRVGMTNPAPRSGGRNAGAGGSPPGGV